VIGLPILHHGGVSKGGRGGVTENGGYGVSGGYGGGVVHDAVLRVIGFTLLAGDLCDVCPKVSFVSFLFEWSCALGGGDLSL
jgi:hypothetical protein